MKYYLILFGILLLSIVGASELPTYDGWVNDGAQVLDDGQRVELESFFTFIEQNTSAELVFISVNTTEPLTPEEYRTKLFAAWHIGKADTDNGLLILYAVHEHRLEVEVGYGLEGILPDSKIGRLLDEQYVPLRDAGNVSEGIVALASALGQVVLDNAEEVRSGQTASVPDWVAVLIISGVVGLFILVGWYSITHPSQRRSGGWFVGGFGGSSGLGGGGFSGFGGGGSGGGGAGR